MSDRRPFLGNFVKYGVPVTLAAAALVACSGDGTQVDINAQMKLSPTPGAATRDINSFPLSATPIPGRQTRSEAIITPTPAPMPESHGPTQSIDDLNIELTVRKATTFREIIAERAKPLPEFNLGKIIQFKDVNNADLTTVPWTAFPADFVQKYGIESFTSFTVSSKQGEAFFMTFRLNGVQATEPKQTAPGANSLDIPLSAFMVTTENNTPLSEVVGGIVTVTEKGRYLIFAFGGGAKQSLDKLSGKQFVVLINSGVLTKDGTPNSTFSLPYRFKFDAHSLTPAQPLIPTGPIRPA